MKPNERLLWSTGLALSLAVNVLVFAAPAHADIETYHRYQQIWQKVYEFVGRRHVEKVSDKELVIGSIRGMLAATKDPYTRFLDREEFREFKSAEDGRKVGIGVEVTMRGEVPLVIAPIEGGPADRAGVRAGDRILSVDGHSTRRRTFGEILKLISGDVGTVVNLQVGRNGIPKPISLRITRGVFNLEYVQSAYLQGGQVGYLRLLHFFGTESGSVEKFRRALVQFRERKVRGVIVDLRNNSGGHLQMAVQLAGYFLKPGQVVVIGRGREKEDERVLSAPLDPLLLPEDVPVVVLVNRGSASASEVFAGALQDHKRARLVGERTFGKASVQQIVTLPDETAALITIQKYYTPNHRSPHRVGLKPDVPVAAIEPNVDETYFLSKIQSDGYLEEFRKTNPTYSPEALNNFLAATKGRGWPLSVPVATLFLKRVYSVQSSGPDLDTDPQLSKALEALAR